MSYKNTLLTTTGLEKLFKLALWISSSQVFPSLGKLSLPFYYLIVRWHIWAIAYQSSENEKLIAQQENALVMDNWKALLSSALAMVDNYDWKHSPVGLCYHSIFFFLQNVLLCSFLPIRLWAPDFYRAIVDEGAARVNYRNQE